MAPDDAVPARVPGTLADRFAAVTGAVVARLPYGLDRVVAPSLVGFVLINTTTFGVDLGLLTLLRSGLAWPLAAAISGAYAVAFGLGFALNRVLNFRSHADLVPQVAGYVALVVVNYLVWVLGLSSWLTHLGLDYRLARISSGACEVVYLYVALRWIVFRDVRPPATGTPPAT